MEYIMEKTLTIFTPTYNRMEKLKDCYDSLKRQSNKDFIWMIVDDGSTDQTEELVSEWINQKIIKIEYIKKENGGKASAINLSIDNCKTNLWMCLDSDDILTDNAVEIILKSYSDIIKTENICGLLALRTGKDGNVMNNKSRVPNHVQYATLTEIRYYYKIDTEYAIVYKTEIAQKYKYPLIPGEKFMPLSYVYDQIDQKYQYKIIHEDVMVSEYLDDGITRNKKNILLKNPKGFILFNKQRMVLAPNFRLKVKAVILYIISSILDKDTSFSKCIKESPQKLLTILLYLPSFILCKVVYEKSKK